MKKSLALALLGSILACTANAQTLLYEWNFTNNVSGTLTNMPPAYTDPGLTGTGNLIVTNISGTAAGTLAYFTNGVGTGPAVTGVANPSHPEFGSSSAAGAYLCTGQSYGGGGNAAVALCKSNVNLGTLYKFTITTWFQMGPSMSGRFPRFFMFSQNANYDEGSFNGVAGSVNGWNSGIATRVQNDLGAASGAANNQSPLLPANFDNSALGLPNGINPDNATWYFLAEVYDGTKSSGQWSSWLGTTTTNVVQVDLQTLNFLGINFTTNATLQIGNRPDGGRGFSDGQIADLRIYRGICSSNNLEAIRTLQMNNYVDDGSGNANTRPSLQSQPVSGANYPGGSRTFTVDVAGLTPLSYQWKSNNVVIASATNATLTLTNIPLSANGVSFVCTITNGLGSTNSAAGVLAVVTAPPGSYAEQVVTNKPFGYWHFNETTNGVADTAAPLPVFDYINGNDGAAKQPTNSGFNVLGLSSPSYPGFSTTNVAIRTVANGHLSQLDLPAISTFTNGMTICGWIYSFGSPASHGIFYSQLGGEGNTVGHGYGLWVNGLDPNGSGGGVLGFEWNNSVLLNSPSGDNNVILPADEWTFVALTIDSTGSNATLYAGSHSRGFQVSVNDTNLTADFFAPLTGNDRPTVLGRSPYAFAEDNTSAFAGINMAFNDMAVFYQALPAQTLTNMYVTGAGPIVPTLTGIPDPNQPGNLLLTWNFGTLQEASDVIGPYTDVGGPPTSPYSVPMTEDKKFYRAKY